MGIEFFKKVKRIQEKHQGTIENHLIRNAIQSNLTLLTSELWAFLREEGFLLGSSLDGYEEMHNSTRVFKNGKGSFDKVMGAIDLARSEDNGKSYVGTIVVLTKDKLDKIPEIYSFFKESRINFEVNFPSIVGEAVGNRSDLEVTPKEWGEAMVELFNLWFYDKSEPFIEIPGLVKYAVGALTGVVDYCSFGGSCRERYISVSPNGDVYPCGKFGSTGDFLLGNIGRDPLEKIMSSDTQKYLLSRSADSIEDCIVCDYKKMCNAGCLYNAYLGHNDPLAKDPLCEGYKVLFEHMKTAMSAEIER